MTNINNNNNNKHALSEGASADSPAQGAANPAASASATWVNGSHWIPMLNVPGERRGLRTLEEYVSFGCGPTVEAGPLPFPDWLLDGREMSTGVFYALVHRSFAYYLASCPMSPELRWLYGEHLARVLQTKERYYNYLLRPGSIPSQAHAEIMCTQ